MTAAWPWLLCALLGAAVHASPSSGRDPDLGCPAPRSPENGLSFIFNRGRLVRYRCHPGFTLRGHGQAVCHHNTWNRPAPLCLAKNATRRGGARLPHPGEDKRGERQPFEWDSSKERLPLTNWKKAQLGGDQRMRHHGVRGSRERDESAAEQVLSRHSVHSADSWQHLKKEEGHHSLSSAEQADREDGTLTESAELSAPREALRKQSDISRFWRSHYGEHSAEGLSSGNNETTGHKAVSRAFKRSYLHSDDDYDLDDDDDSTQSTHRGDMSPYDDDEEEHGRNSPRTVTFERGPKGDREPYDPSASRSSPVDYFGRPVQVLSGEKAHQQDALLRRQYEMAQQHRRAKVEEFRAREEVRFEPPPPDNTAVTSRPLDYFGRPVQVHTGEKAAQAEALLKRQYEMVQQRMQDNQLQEVRKRPDADYFPRQGVSEDAREYRGDREPLSGVTSRPVDYFGRPVQVLTGDKAAQAEAMLRRQYEEYQARLSSRPSEPDYAVGRPVEFNRRPVQPASSPPFDHFGRPVQVLTGEKAGQQTELLRQQYDMAQRGAAFQEARGRPTEEHRHRHQHGEQGTSGALRLSREDLELMSRLSPQLRASFVRDLRQARIKEETDPERANRFLSRYRSQSVSADEMLADEPTESTTEDTSSETSTESSTKATYDQSCLQDRKRGRSFLSAPKVKHAYVYKYERKVLGKPAQSHYVLARYKCLLGYTLKYAQASALYCRQRQWIGEHPTCVRSSTLSAELQ
ncbi:uncharacterized protein LOC119382403 isoform X1 [Rhipicephalus sanguineus]|uniref:uncharacterized protein LOC119382403 isoform X1 n=1 Tax=Rhipicephalus sanguineus TaxID=34632 RepID=UPI0018932539|nr:uncharacterized protein LOC119382403 isoform X1 [Rhipicephalus sanguineus]